MKRNLIFTLLILVIVLAAAFAYFYFKQTPDVLNDKPQAVVSATELVDAFDKDTAAASRLFIDKVIEVSGNVKQIDTSGAVVMGEEGSPSEVVVGLDRRHTDDYKQLAIGQPAVVQGICSGYSKSGSSDPTDMLAALGTTVHLRSAGVKAKK
ncbi:MAG TPA: hypothetical protein VFL47_02380 [Flavisolibacter sp.]|nr:hypothetical protein [Flavisolibacter sp.]